MMSQRFSGRRSGGQARSGLGAFTLVELLVVVSIIALLISILLPSLKKAREQAKAAVCIAGVKNSAMASLVYAADDSTEASVPVHPKIYDVSMTEGLRRATMVYGFGGKSGRGKEGSDVLFWGTARDLGPATRPLNKFIYKDGFVNYRTNPGPGFINWKNDTKLDMGMFRCPSDDGYQGTHYTAWRDSKLSSYDHYGTSFAANLLWIYTPGSGDCGGSCCSSNAPGLRPLSRIPNPSNTLYYEENAGRYTFLHDPVDTSCDTPREGVVHGWHGRDWIFNVAFADAHAGPVKMKGYQNPRLSEYPILDYQHWHCVIIRGPGYQRDTLPSPPVKTDVPCGS